MKLKEVSVSFHNLSLKTTHIGSLPFTDLEKALDIAFCFDIPAWPQLPKFKEEGMLWQFLSDFPGFDLEKERIFTNTPSFEEELLTIYESYVEITENHNITLLKEQFRPNYSKAFFPFLERAKGLNPYLLKGQITGPFTLGISLKTEKNESLIFRDDLRDLLLKYLTLKALAQAYFLKDVAQEVILFLDEPGLSGFGSSAYISLSKEFVLELLSEIVEGLKKHGFIVGIHVCANTSWDLLLDSGFDLINFDSFSFFEKFSIYADKIAEFLAKPERYLAFGVVPTTSSLLEKVEREEIIRGFQGQISILAEKIALAEPTLLKRVLFTPACGMGSLPEHHVDKVLYLLKELQKTYLEP
jgi:methionine synthase II (cobalamin-independent)